MHKSTIKIIYLFSMVTPALCSYSWNDGMGRREKEKMVWLSNDLFKDSLLKLRQIFEIREEHEEFISYHVGLILGRIREKYKFMVETYREIYDKTNNRLDLRPPGYQSLRTVHYIVALEMMHYLAVEIDKLLHVLEDTALKDINSHNFLVGRDIPKQSRSGPERSELREKAIEELEKSMLRQRYLMKKIGQPVNMTTTKKRFIKRWPVEDTWSLEKYNYN